MAKWHPILKEPNVSITAGTALSVTPIEEHGGILCKREDLFEVAGIRGGKVRACWVLAQGAKGLVTAGSRQSPQVNIVAQIAKYMKIPCRIHTAKGELGEEVKEAVKTGAELFQWNMGYSNVLACRAREDAKKMGWTEIPFGMESVVSIACQRNQVVNIPSKVRRIVVCVGSGMCLSGVLHGMIDHGYESIPVLGVRVGGGTDKTKFSPVLERRLDKFAPPNWREMVKFEHCGLDYHKFAPVTKLGDLELDPIYEAKCIPFLKKSDLFWVIGIRQTAVNE